MKVFHLTVSSVSESKFDGEAISLQVSGTDGDMEVLADHEPLITTLKEGTIIIKTAAGADQGGGKDNKDGEKFVIEKGILEVANNRVVVLV